MGYTLRICLSSMRFKCLDFSLVGDENINYLLENFSVFALWSVFISLFMISCIEFALVILNLLNARCQLFSEVEMWDSLRFPREPSVQNLLSARMKRLENLFSGHQDARPNFSCSLSFKFKNCLPKNWKLGSSKGGSSAKKLL